MRETLESFKCLPVQVDQRYLEASPFALVALDSNLTVLEVNALYSQITLKSREETVGLNLFDAFPAPDDVNAKVELEKAVKAVFDTSTSLRLPVVRHDLEKNGGGFKTRYWELTIFPWIDEGEVRFVIQQVNDITERVRFEGVHKARQRTAAGRANLAFWEYDLETGASNRSSSFNAMHGLPMSSDDPDFDIFRNVHPEDRPRLEGLLKEGLRPEAETIDTDYRVVIGDETRWLVGRAEITNVPATDNPTLVGTVADITTLREKEAALRVALAERNLLLAEIHHRVSNSLQLVSSVISLEAEAADSPAAVKALNSTSARIDAIAAIHRTLHNHQEVDTVEFDQVLQTFCRQLAKSTGAEEHGVELILSTQPVSLQSDQAVVLSLIVNELVLNSFKHAFSDGRGGHLKVDLHVSDDDKVSLKVEDDGPPKPIPDAIETDGLGTMIVRGSVEQLGGSFDLDRGERGWTATVTFKPRETRRDAP